MEYLILIEITRLNPSKLWIQTILGQVKRNTIHLLKLEEQKYFISNKWGNYGEFFHSLSNLGTFPAKHWFLLNHIQCSPSHNLIRGCGWFAYFRKANSFLWTILVLFKIQCKSCLKDCPPSRHGMVNQIFPNFDDLILSEKLQRSLLFIISSKVFDHWDFWSAISFLRLTFSLFLKLSVF